MTLNDPELMVREWLEKLYALAGPGADMARAALDLLDEWGQPDSEEDVLERMIEEGKINECYESFSQIGRDLDQLYRVQELMDEADLITLGDADDVNLVPLLRMFLPV